MPIIVVVGFVEHFIVCMSECESLCSRSAGVSGLTCAYLLSKQKENTVTIIAKHMPGDYDIEYASPIAGANVLP